MTGVPTLADVLLEEIEEIPGHYTEERLVRDLDVYSPEEIRRALDLLESRRAVVRDAIGRYSPRDPRPTALVDGVWCTLVDGAWVPEPPEPHTLTGEVPR